MFNKTLFFSKMTGANSALKVSASFDEESCFTDEKKSKSFDTLDIVFTTAMVILGSIVILSTLKDMWKR